MDLKTYLSGERGRLSALSKAVGAHAPDVSRWASGDRPIPIPFGLPIEQATSGQVTRLDMFSREVIEKVWPELLKRKSRRMRLDQIAASDDTQPPVGGTNNGAKQARAKIQ